MPNNKVLVTGAQGFTGQYVCDALRIAGYDVIGLGQSSASNLGYFADLCDLVSLRKVISAIKPNYVIHLAAIAFVGHADFNNFYRTNLFGTLNLLEAIYLECPQVSNIIVASSANVYGNPVISPVSELVCPAPLNHYAMSKLAMEHMSRTWFERLPIIIVRPFNYTGHRQSIDFLIPKIVSHFHARAEKISLGNLDVTREFNDVRMIARAYVDILQVDSGITINLCSGIGYELNNVLQLASELSRHHIIVDTSPALVRQNELKSLVGDPSVMQQLLPNLPTYSLYETLEWMFEGAEK
ncbi:GDP-mannose 4,6-dehydratase [Chitinibacter bivalviorum]|uniref:GDP-mannose 4,6-dehydratase n=1 Tax=Chitinibacter bivalviorum TaxID=2739434 RepID=A0A7H9BNP2_9NEIS|nr:GDP-mannose 4,6-dehydratase [Chitinibacter bivalviorum]QLG89661.1 GDP-mannose 4,6-dehydratase [Chitinibacter bivalviorum]